MRIRALGPCARRKAGSTRADRRTPGPSPRRRSGEGASPDRRPGPRLSRVCHALHAWLGALLCVGRRSRARFWRPAPSEDRKRHLSRSGPIHGSFGSSKRVVVSPRRAFCASSRVLRATGWGVANDVVSARARGRLGSVWHASGTRVGMAPTLGARIYHIRLLFLLSTHFGALAQVCARLSA